MIASCYIEWHKGYEELIGKSRKSIYRNKENDFQVKYNLNLVILINICFDAQFFWLFIGYFNGTQIIIELFNPELF